MTKGNVALHNATIDEYALWRKAAAKRTWKGDLRLNRAGRRLVARLERQGAQRPASPSSQGARMRTGRPRRER